MSGAVAIVGGGISGLAAAYELTRRGVPFELFERSDRCGGVVVTERVGGYTIDAGPDALLTQKPAATALCAELGLASRLRGQQTQLTYVMRGGRLRLLPPTSVFGLPTAWLPFAATDAFSIGAKIRMAAEVFVPRKRLNASDADESIGSFMRRRFGKAAVEYLAEPLLAGIHGGDPSRLSMHLGFPRLVDLEQRHGSVIVGLRGMTKAPTGASPFVSLPDGMAALTDAIRRTLPARCVHVDCGVESIDRTSSGYALHLSDGRSVLASAALLCTPPRITGRLTQHLDAELASLCSRIRSTSAVTVALGYARSAVRHPLNGTGFVAPRREGCRLRAVSWVSSKWSDRAPSGRVLMRAYIGGAADPGAIDRDAATIVDDAHRDISRIVRIAGEPDLVRIYRWRNATPQIEVGHAALMRTIEQRLASQNALFITGSGFRGTGIPDCIADARRQAGFAAESVAAALSA